MAFGNGLLGGCIMKRFLKTALLISAVIGITFTGCNNSVQTSKENEIIKMKEELDDLKSELDVLEDELEKKRDEVLTLLGEKNSKYEYFFDMGEFYYITVNDKKIESKCKINDEYGLYLSVICDIWSDLNIEIQEYTNKTFGGFGGETIPTKFKVSYKGKSVEFEGIAYASSVNGAPTARYFAGQFGQITARYKAGIMFEDKGSFLELCRLLGIDCTFDKNTINFYTGDDYDQIIYCTQSKIFSIDLFKNVRLLYEDDDNVNNYGIRKVFNYEKDKILLLDYISEKKYKVYCLDTKSRDISDLLKDYICRYEYDYDIKSKRKSVS